MLSCLARSICLQSGNHIRAAVVPAREVRQMEGKKTDMGDAEWLAHIGRLGVF